MRGLHHSLRYRYLPSLYTNSDTDCAKAGKLRTPEDTTAAIREQLRLSTLSGGTDKAKKAATATGVNDASSAPVVDLLLEMGKELRRRGAGKTALPEAEIQKILEDEMVKQLKRNPINPLIGMRGMSSPYCISRKSNMSAPRCRYSQGYAYRNPPHHPAWHREVLLGSDRLDSGEGEKDENFRGSTSSLGHSRSQYRSNQC